MPVFSLTLEETNRSILSSVYYKIVDDIAETIKLPKDSLVVLYKDTEVALTDARPNTSIQTALNTPTTATKRRIQVTVTEDYNEDSLTTTAVNRQEYYPIFRDTDISVDIAPIYIQTDVEIEFVYVTPSMAEAKRIRDDIRLRLSQTRNIGHHEVEYNIIIPTVVEEFIADVHELKSRLHPQELGDYFLEHSTKRVHQITDMASKENIRLAVFERQIRILGMFNFSSMPEKVERDGDSSTYRVSLKYTFSLSVPRAMVVRYPTMICNRTLPPKYLEFIEQHKIHSGREYKRDLNYIGYSLYNLSHFEANRQLEDRVNINVPITVPLFDDFSLREGHKGYGILVSFLPEVNEDDYLTLFNLRDIDPYYIPEVLLKYLIDGERQYVVSPYSSFIYFGLHQEDRHFDNPVLEITEDLTVRSKLPINVDKPVRVTIGYIIQFSMLLPEAIERLLQNRDILILFIPEYISAVNTFKNEVAQLGPPDLSFYYFLIRVLLKYLDLGDLDLIKLILDIIRQDYYTYMLISRILVTEYPDSLQRLEGLGFVPVTRVKNLLPSVRYYTDRAGMMKTVQSVSVIAEKISP